MEEVNISETESRYFGDLFVCCDVEKSGKVPILKATEMFRSANLSNDDIRQITSVAGIPQTAIHMSRVQFYSCLKLIAAHQSDLPLREELISSTTTLPLPKFTWPISPSSRSNESRSEMLNGRNGSVLDEGQWRKSIRSPNLIQLVTNTESHNETLNSDIPSTDSEVDHTDDTDTKERIRRRGGSPEAWSTASDSPTPTNSVTERPWAKNTLWQGLFCEEQRQLLGTEEESSDRHSSDEDNEVDLETIYQITPEQREYYLLQFRAVQPDLNGLLSGSVARVFFEKSRIPVEELRHIWQLCDVTRDGALSLAEFTAAMHLVVLRRNTIPLPSVLPACLQPATIIQQGTGSVAPVAGPAEADLLHLDDDQTDSSSVELPNTNSMSFEKDKMDNRRHVIPHHYQHHHNLHTSSTSPITISQKSRSHSSSPPLPPPPSVSDQSPTMPAVINKDATDWMNQSKEWTKFTESPTSNVSSPGPKPVNFDMQRTAQAVVSDPLILHPVPVRVTPIGVDALDDESSSRTILRKSDAVAVVYDSAAAAVAAVALRDPEASPKHVNTSYNSQQRDSLQNELRAIQRPQPKKVPSKNIGAIPPPPQREPSIGSCSGDIPDAPTSIIPPALPVNVKKDAPPLPPPRPHKHARSSSLDLNKLKLNAPTPPEVPPRVSPQIISQVSLDVGDSNSFADFTHFPDEGTNNLSTMQSDPSSRYTIPSLQSSLRSSAFEVYRKPTTPKGYNSPESIITSTAVATAPTSSNTSGPRPIVDYEKRVSVINESLRHVTFKQERSLNEVMLHLKEQNNLLLRLCNDLSEELTTVQRKKEELKSKYDVNPSGHHSIV